MADESIIVPWGRESENFPFVGNFDKEMAAKYDKDVPPIYYKHFNIETKKNNLW